MKTIVAATDFSDVSLNAVNYAVSMAEYLKKDLVIVHVCELAQIATEFPYPVYDLTVLQDDAQTSMKNLEENIRRQMISTGNMSTVIRTGDVLTQLNEYCSGLQVYAVVMGIHGAGGKDRQPLFGSNTLGALKQLSYPLIIVPESAGFHAIERVGIASDFLNVSQKIHFADIRKFIRELHADLHVIHVKQANRADKNENRSDEFRVFRELMAEFNPAYHIVEHKHLGEAVNELVRAMQIELLIVMPGKHTGLEKIFHKSGSRELVLQTQVPILAIHQ